MGEERGELLHVVLLDAYASALAVAPFAGEAAGDLLAGDVDERGLVARRFGGLAVFFRLAQRPRRFPRREYSGGAGGPQNFREAAVCL